MRYFEIAKAPTRYILADADGKAPSGNHAALVERPIGDFGAWTVGIPRTGSAILPGRRTYLIGGHIGSIYRPGVRNSASQFPPSQPTAANSLFKGSTDYLSSVLPLFI
jgi:hypothetical protein